MNGPAMQILDSVAPNVASRVRELVNGDGPMSQARRRVSGSGFRRVT